MNYDHLIGREYIGGRVDCYGLVRDFYKDVFNIDLPNYARPKDWWNLKLDLYTERYYKNGFRLIDVHPSEYQFGDVFLISYRSEVPNHAAVLVEKGKILHHFTNRLSSVDPYQGVWRNNTVGVYRHKDVVLPVSDQTAEIVNYLPSSVRRKIDAAIQSSQKPE